MRTIVLSLTVMAGLAAQAQLFDLGLKGGLNRDDLRTGLTHEPLWGGHAGLFARVKPPVLPGVQGEVLLSSLGSRVSAEGYAADLRTAALQVPLFAVFSLGPAELHVGGYYERYLTKSFDVELAVDIGDVTLDERDLADEGYGLLAGAGLRLGHFYAGARYLHGLEDLGNSTFFQGVRSQQLQFYIGLGFFRAPD
ncbi:MAG: outer membrane beta-barrel protein [Flavobacteriales bacterium]